MRGGSETPAASAATGETDISGLAARMERMRIQAAP